MTLTDWLVTQANALTVAFKTVITLALIVIFAINILKAGLSISRVISALLVAGLIFWAIVLDGLMDVARLLANTFGF
ncbi:Uncharacterised protein [Mycobacteroides abscessus subsp. abscessus]|nr:Uncharacterised protein [Mycobacteroides abscessus subsp. abscessus]